MDNRYKYKPSSRLDSAKNNRIINIKCLAEQMLQNAVIMTETAMELKEKSLAAEKYVSYLRNLSMRAGKTIKCLQGSGKTFLFLTQKLITSTLSSLDSFSVSDPACITVKQEYERLLSIVEKELADLDDGDIVESSTFSNCFKSQSITKLSEKIKYLEAKQKRADNNFLPPCGSSRSVKSDVDEKYPENLSRESLIDLNNVANLPPVPEDVFTSFSTKPLRTSSLSSIKSMRKVKLFLQRASSGSDDEDESCSEIEDSTDFSRVTNGENDVNTTSLFSHTPRKIQLSYIQEEMND